MAFIFNPSPRTIAGHETGAPWSQTLHRRSVKNDIISVCVFEFIHPRRMKKLGATSSP